MCRAERVTTSRGRLSLPRTFLRSRKWRRARASRRRLEKLVSAVVAVMSLACLPGLAPNELALVAHAFALVRVGPAQLADVRGNLADLLLVDALHDEPGGRLDP